MKKISIRFVKTKPKQNQWWDKMSNEHFNEPGYVGFSKKNGDIYRDWTDKDSKSIFANKRQKDLFIFAMALGKYSVMESDLVNRDANIPVDSMKEQQKWALLSIGVSEMDDLLCLKDEKPLYSKAEKYAEEGLKILESHIDRYGTNYPKALEIELKEILGVLEK